MPVSEMQARWATSVVKNEIPLPSPEQMHDSIAAYQNGLKKAYANTARHTIRVEFYPYMDMLARELGAHVTFGQGSEWSAEDRLGLARPGPSLV